MLHWKYSILKSEMYPNAYKWNWITKPNFYSLQTIQFQFSSFTTLCHTAPPTPYASEHQLFTQIQAHSIFCDHYKGLSFQKRTKEHVCRALIPIVFMQSWCVCVCLHFSKRGRGRSRWRKRQEQGPICQHSSRIPPNPVWVLGERSVRQLTCGSFFFFFNESAYSH